MYLLEGKVTGNVTTLVIILFKDLSKRCNSTKEVEKIGRECLYMKVEFIKQWVEPESTRDWIGIYWMWSSTQTNRKKRERQREFGLKRADTLRYIGLVVAQTSSTQL